MWPDAAGAVECGAGREPRTGWRSAILEACGCSATTFPEVELVDLPEFGPDEAARIAGGEPDPFGTDHLGIVWQEKTDHVGLIDDGHLIGYAGWTARQVSTADGQVVEVLGLGGVMVQSERRGSGVGGELVLGAMQRMRAAGGVLAMLFCRAERLAFYERLGWIPIRDDVTVEQPGGGIVMPLHTCWTPLVEGATMPAGELGVEGLPF